MTSDQGDLDVSRETLEQLRRFYDLLVKWNKTINLVAPGTLGDGWQRHIQDSIEICSHARTNAGIWADLGAGGGLPGAIAAILKPNRSVVLIESDQRKGQFLRAVRREIAPNMEIVTERIEKAQPQQATTLSARALAPLPLLCAYAKRHSVPETEYLFPKGENWEAELQSAQQSWTFDYEILGSTGPGRTLRLTNLEERA